MRGLTRDFAGKNGKIIFSACMWTGGRRVFGSPPSAMRLRKDGSPGSSEEGVADFQGPVVRSMMHVFGVEDGCAGADGGLDDEGVPVADVALPNALEGKLNQGRVDGEDRVLAKLADGARNFYLRERWLPFSCGNRDELAEYLRTDNEVILFGKLIHQPPRDVNLLGLTLVCVGEGVEENICVYERGHFIRSAYISSRVGSLPRSPRTPSSIKRTRALLSRFRGRVGVYVLTESATNWSRVMRRRSASSLAASRISGSIAMVRLAIRPPLD